MKRGILFLVLLLGGCAYRNPLEKADFRFQTIMVPPYVLSSWYRIADAGHPLVVYVEDNETFPSETVRAQAVRDPSANVAYIGRPCQYFETAACQKGVSPDVSDQVVQKGIEQLKKKAGTTVVTVKGIK